MQLEKIHVSLSKPQQRKLARGQTVQLSKDKLRGSVALAVSPHTKKRYDSCCRRSKGMRLSLSPSEVEGSGLASLLKRAAKASMKAGKKVVKTVYDNRQEIIQGLKAANEIKNLVQELRGSGLSDDDIRGAGLGYLLEDGMVRQGKKVVRQGKKVVKDGKKLYEDGKDLVERIQELKGEGMPDDEIAETLQGEGFWGDVGKTFHSVARVAKHVPVVGAPIGMADDALTVGETVAKLASKKKRRKRGRGMVPDDDLDALAQSETRLARHVKSQDWSKRLAETQVGRGLYVPGERSGRGLFSTPRISPLK